MRPTLIALALSLVACGGPTNCPSQIPTNGASCNNLNLACEYGGAVHDLCTTVATCIYANDPTNASLNTWSVVAPDANCSANNPAACAASYNAVPTGQTCPTSGLGCDYDQGRCTCVPCSPSALAWECRAFGAGVETGCPTMRPLLGTSCPANEVSCSYDSTCNVSFGPDVICTNHLWQPRNGQANPCGEPVCGVSSN